MWVKVCTKDLKCSCFQLTLGENVDIYPYNSELCEQGGLHFCKVEYALQWAQTLEYDWVCDVEIPTDAEVTHGDNKSKASKLTLSNHRPLRECPEIYMAAVQHDGRMLMYIPKELKTFDMCLVAVCNHGYALKDVPDELKTFGICLVSVQRCGWALEYVPDELKTIGMCMAAVQHSGWPLQYVPDDLKTPEMCLYAVLNTGMTLYYVPVELKTFKMCLAAAQQDAIAMLYMPPDIQDEMRSMITTVSK